MVRSSPVFLARPAWYDRNPAPSGSAYFTDGVAPHALTARHTYAVPTGKTAIMTSLFVFCRRATAATTVGKVEVRFLAGAGLQIYWSFIDNTAGIRFTWELSPHTIVLAGTTIYMYTADGSTGGTVDYAVSIGYVTFDA